MQESVGVVIKSGVRDLDRNMSREFSSKEKLNKQKAQKFSVVIVV